MQPVLFRISDNFFIPTYGFMIATGLVIALLLAAWRAKARGMNPEHIYDLTLIAVISGFVGARILYILTDLPGFLASPTAYIFTGAGFVFLGGLFGAIIGCGIYAWKKQLDFLKTADVLIPSLAIGHAFGRIGCHLAGCCFGGLCQAPIGIQVPRIFFPNGDLAPNAFAEHWAAGLVPPDATVSLPIWPVQLMETGFLFLLAAVLLFLAMRPIRKGLIFGIYLIAYGIGRSILELFRGDDVRGEDLLLGLSTSQLLSVPLVIAGIALVLYSRKNELVGPMTADQLKEASKPKRYTTG